MRTFVTTTEINRLPLWTDNTARKSKPGDRWDLFGAGIISTTGLPGFFITQTFRPATTNNAGTAIIVDQDNNNIAVDMDIESTTVDVFNMDLATISGIVFDANADAITTGSLFDGSLNGLSTGKGLKLATTSTVLAAGELIDVDATISGSSITAKTGSLVDYAISRTDTRTTGTTADDYDVGSFKRTSIMNGTGGTLTAAGSVVRIENVATQTLGTLTDTVKGIELVMDADGSGDGLFIDYNNATGLFLNADIETTTGTGAKIFADVLTSGTVVQISANSADTSASYLLDLLQDHVSATGRIPLRIQNDSTSVDLQIINNDAGALGAKLEMYGNSATPANSDVAGRISMYGEDNEGNKIEYGQIDCEIITVTSNVDTSQLSFTTRSGGAAVEALRIRSGRIQVNEQTYITLSAGNTDIFDEVDDLAALSLYGESDAVKYYEQMVALGIATPDPEKAGGYWFDEAREKKLHRGAFKQVRNRFMSVEADIAELRDLRVEVASLRKAVEQGVRPSA